MHRILTLFPALAAAALIAAPAAAEPVSYTTEGTFTGDGDSDSVFTVTDGGLEITISYSGQSPTLIDSPAVGDLGELEVNIVGEGTTSFTGMFDLTIEQTAPSMGADSLLNATLTGTNVGAEVINGILTPTGVISLTFADTVAQIGLTTYELVVPLAENPTLFVDITGNPTRPSAFIQVIPEPASLAMAGLGALGVAGLGLRRRMRKS